MSSDDKDRPRKTLTIKKTARDAHAEEAPKRTRTGARARLVAQISRTKENVERQKDPEGYQRRQEEEARRKPGAGARGQYERGQPSRGEGRGAAGRGSAERGTSERGGSARAGS
ncbi:MAG: hypothetical protein ACN6O0_19460 [Achromobacter spanius]